MSIPKGGVRTRFAPSPTGHMHVGNLRTALYAYLIARKNAGRFILRIEDTDLNRFTEGAVEAIFKTLDECGLIYDEGPDKPSPSGPYVQTERREIYSNYAELLIKLGGAYRCFCEKDAQGEDGPGAGAGRKYDGRCGRLSESRINELLEAKVPFVIRQKIPQEGETSVYDEVFGKITVKNDTLDDNVLIKSDGLPTYNFANVIDDRLMGITHVVRGTEYLSSAPKYNLLYESFGWEPPKYIHCPPVMRDANNKMSKRRGDPSYEDLTALGYLAPAVINYVALLGWSPGGEREMFSLSELCGVFDIAGISKSPAIFDIEKLAHFNSEYIRAMPAEEFAVLARPYIRKAVKNPCIDPDLIAPLLQQRCEKLSDIPGKLDFFDTTAEYDTELYIHKKSKTDEAVSSEMLKAALPALESVSAWDDAGINRAMAETAERLGVKNATLMWPVRTAVSGKAVTPGGAVEICRILGKAETLARIEKGIEKLRSAVERRESAEG
ncbi:MAG: glutamate--tRNA ligase [Oscillospiraceae bacterium]|nr:glutamate--tRNA ligase [Oscillospiraceae bacterium]